MRMYEYPYPKKADFMEYREKSLIDGVSIFYFIVKSGVSFELFTLIWR